MFEILLRAYTLLCSAINGPITFVGLNQQKPVNNGIGFHEFNVCTKANNKYDIIKCYVFIDDLGEQALIRAAVLVLDLIYSV